MLAERYELVRKIGEGGMGVVWEATSHEMGCAVAIKSLKKSESATLARFLREARLAASLAHPNIVHVLDFFEEDDNAFMVMELLHGESLTKRLRRGPLSLEQTSHIVLAVGEALDAAHGRGIVHRDLKPDNIFWCILHRIATQRTYTRCRSRCSISGSRARPTSTRPR